jgi:hypothetical protein
MKLRTGLHQIDREAYDRIARVNFSTLKNMAKSPAHYEHCLTEKDEDTDAKQLGRVVAMACFEPERFRAECVVWDMGRRAGKDWQAFRDRHQGMEILTDGAHAKALAIGKAARSHPVSSRYMTGGRGEVTALWTHEAPAVGGLAGYSVDCKGRLDFLANAGAIVDLKTCRDASPEGFGRACAQYDYVTQAAFYSDGVKAATGKEWPFVIVAIESAAPYVVQVYQVPDELIEYGRDRYRTMLDRLVMCRSESRWPGYSEDVLPLTLPRWAMPANDDEDVDGLDLIVNG